MNIDGARILVTGGCGLIGSTTIDLLLRDHAPERIVVLDNLSRGSLANLEQSLDALPRPVYVIYHNPQLAIVVNNTGRLKRIAATHQYAIFTAT